MIFPNTGNNVRARDIATIYGSGGILVTDPGSDYISISRGLRITFPVCSGARGPGGPGPGGHKFRFPLGLDCRAGGL